MTAKLNTVEKAGQVVSDTACCDQIGPCCCTRQGEGERKVTAILTAWAAEPPECMVEKLVKLLFGETMTKESLGLMDNMRGALRAAFTAARDEQGGGG